MQNIFESEGYKTGSLVDDGLRDNMLITFNDNAPEDYLDYVLALRNIKNELVCIDDDYCHFLGIKDKFYEITAMGDAAWENLCNLGHVTIIFDGAHIPTGYGSIHVVCHQVPKSAELIGSITLARVKK